MNRHNVETLIVTPSVVLQQGLGAFLESLPGIAGVKAIRELHTAYAWIEAHQPGIVLLDASLLKNRSEAALEKIQAISPASQRVLLVDDVQEVNLMPKYAEAILIKGVSPAALTTIVTKLLSEKGDTHEHNVSN